MPTNKQLGVAALAAVAATAPAAQAAKQFLQQSQESQVPSQQDVATLSSYGSSSSSVAMAGDSGAVRTLSNLCDRMGSGLAATESSVTQSWSSLFTKLQTDAVAIRAEKQQINTFALQIEKWEGDVQTFGGEIEDKEETLASLNAQKLRLKDDIKAAEETYAGLAKTYRNKIQGLKRGVKQLHQIGKQLGKTKKGMQAIGALDAEAEGGTFKVKKGRCH